MAKARTSDEVKKDIRDRIGRRAPFLHADQIETEEALAKMTTFEGEIWAAAWNDLGARWEARANTAEKHDGFMEGPKHIWSSGNCNEGG